MEETIKYKCTKCNLQEDIPKEVVEYFDEMDQSNIDEPPCFWCKMRWYNETYKI